MHTGTLNTGQNLIQVSFLMNIKKNNLSTISSRLFLSTPCSLTVVVFFKFLSETLLFSPDMWINAQSLLKYSLIGYQSLHPSPSCGWQLSFVWMGPPGLTSISSSVERLTDFISDQMLYRLELFTLHVWKRHVHSPILSEYWYWMMMNLGVALFPILFGVSFVQPSRKEEKDYLQRVLCGNSCTHQIQPSGYAYLPINTPPLYFCNVWKEKLLMRINEMFHLPERYQIGCETKTTLWKYHPFINELKLYDQKDHKR